MVVKNLEKIFDPKNIALIGASDEIGSVGYTLLENLTKYSARAAKPSIISRVLSEIFLIKRTGNAPMPVANPARRLVVNPSLIIS